MKPIRTCILIADGAHARVYLNEGPGKGIEELKKFAHDAELKPSREIDADRPGRTFDSGGQGRHAMESPTDSSRHAKAEFHREIAGKIESAVKAGEFDRLVLVAPPATLGDLRQEFARVPAVEIHAEINKDLTKVGKDDLLAQLGKVIAA